MRCSQGGLRTRLYVGGLQTSCDRSRSGMEWEASATKPGGARPCGTTRTFFRMMRHNWPEECSTAFQYGWPPVGNRRLVSWRFSSGMCSQRLSGCGGGLQAVKPHVRFIGEPRYFGTTSFPLCGEKLICLISDVGKACLRTSKLIAIVFMLQ